MFPCKSYAVGISIWCKLNYIGCTIWSIYLYIHWSNDCLMKSIPTSSSYSYHLQVIFHMWWCCLAADKQLPPPLAHSSLDKSSSQIRISLSRVCVSCVFEIQLDKDAEATEPDWVYGCKKKLRRIRETTANGNGSLSLLSMTIRSGKEQQCGITSWSLRHLEMYQK